MSIQAGIWKGDGKHVSPAIAQHAGGPRGDPFWTIELTSDGRTYRVTSNATHDALARPVADAGTQEKPTAPTTAAWANVPAQKWTFSAP